MDYINLLCRVESLRATNVHGSSQTLTVLAATKRSGLVYTRTLASHLYSSVCCPAVPVPCQDMTAVCLHTNCPSFMTAVVGLMQKLRRRNRGLVGRVP